MAKKASSVKTRVGAVTSTGDTAGRRRKRDRFLLEPLDWVDDHGGKWGWAVIGAVGAALLASKTSVGAAEVPLIKPHWNWTWPMTAIGIPLAFFGAVGSARKADRAKTYKDAAAASQDESQVAAEAFNEAKAALRALTDARLLMLGQGFSGTWRASLFLISADDSEFHLVGRASPNRNLCKPSTRPYPMTQGLIGQAFTAGPGGVRTATGLPDPDLAWAAYRKAQRAYSVRNVRALTMRSREYAALAMGDSTQRRVIGVLVLESLESPAPYLRTALTKMPASDRDLLRDFTDAHAKLPLTLEVQGNGGTA